MFHQVPLQIQLVLNDQLIITFALTHLDCQHKQLQECQEAE